MRRFGSLSFVLFLICFLPSANGQELAKIRSEYIDNPIRQYQPADPWHRSFLYKLQTGHYGRYYNCDGEEEKRNSPYICWNNYDCPTIPKKNCIDCVNEQLHKIKRRIRDGSCRSSNCSTCQSSTCNCGQSGYVAQPQNHESQVVRRQGNIFEPELATSKTRKTCNCKSCQAKLNSNAVTHRSDVNSHSLQQVLLGQPEPVANAQPPAVEQVLTEQVAPEQVAPEQVTVEQGTTEQVTERQANGQRVHGQAANLLSRIKNTQSLRTAEAIGQPTSQAAAPWRVRNSAKRR